MPSIVTRKYRVKNAKEFVEALSTAEGDNFYLFIGRSVPWSSSADTNSAAISTPSDTVKETTFDYWRDMIALVRLTPNNVYQVAPRHDWANAAIYNMYDHRSNTTVMYANATSPFYVLNSNNEVFKCLYNGRYPDGNSTSIAEPSTEGLEDVTKLVTTAGTPYSYTWKYLYKIDGDLVTKYLTPEYIPVKTVAGTLETNNTSPNFGDVYDDGSDQYTVFNDARFSNGAIYTVVVEEGGSGYSQGTQVTITGDGTGAQGVAVVDAGSIKQVNMVLRGSNYSYANVTFVDGVGGGTGASATAIISPRNSFTNTTGTHYITNHGINIEHELSGSAVMVYSTLDSTGISGELPLAISYRRVGIVRNPQLYGTSTIATGDEYVQMWELGISNTTGLFTTNELVFQDKGANGVAYGVVTESQATKVKLTHVYGTFVTGINISGIGNGNATGQIAGATTVPATPEAFTPIVPASGSQAAVESVSAPDITPFSGDILVVDHKAPVYRDPVQVETIRFVLSF